MKKRYRCFSVVLWAYFLVSQLCPVYGGNTQIVDEGSVGGPGNPSDHRNLHSTTEVSYGSAAEAIANRYSPSQTEQITTMLATNLGIPLSSLTGTATGTNEQYVQWSDPQPEPGGPTTNFETVTLVTPEGHSVSMESCGS